MLGDAREPSGRRRLLVAGRLVLPPLLDGGADSGIQPGQRAAPSGLYLNDPTAWTDPDPTPDELTGVTT